jgi:HEAT repeats
MATLNQKRMAGTIIAGVISLGLAFHLLQPRQPVYQGRTLSQWLKDIDYGRSPATREQALAAIREMGTNALPGLIADLGHVDSPFRKMLMRAVNIQPWVHVKFRTPNERYVWATLAFEALGPEARPAGPALEALFDSNPIYALHAYAALGPESIPALGRALTNENKWVRWNAASALREFGPQASGTAPLLRLGLQDPDPTVRAQMTKALGAVTPGEAVPAGRVPGGE